jgi:hypothetical protein
VIHDRAVLVEVLVYHYRDGIQGCGCGWAELGKSWPEHVAMVYEESLAARASTIDSPGPWPSPDCHAGKHAPTCDGSRWNKAADAPTACTCECHS